MVKEATSKANPMRYILRVDKEHHSWKVAVRRMNTYRHQYFTDSAYGGTAQALVAAMAWRDATVAELTDVDYAVWRRELMPSRNTSGIVGVSRGLVPKKRGKRIVKFANWTAHWLTASGDRGKRSFSVNKYGEEGAKALAIQARQEGMESVVRQIQSQAS